MILPFDLMRGPVVIRPAGMDDAAAIAGLHAGAFAHPWPVLTIESMLADRAVDADVAEQSGVVIGFVITRAVADEAEILSIAVEPRRRGSGIGRRLVEARSESLALQRVAKVFLEVEDGNAPALALYRRLGFVEIGRRPGYYRTATGERQDAVTMRRDLIRVRPAGRLLDA